MLIISERRKDELKQKVQLIFYGLPIGNNYYKDTPIIGNESLAAVAYNRIESISDNKQEVAFMVECLKKFLLETKGHNVHKIKFDTSSDSAVRSGILDDKGFLIKKSK